MELGLGENTVKGARTPQISVIFQRLHMTCVIFLLVSNIQNPMHSLTLPNVICRNLIIPFVSVPFIGNVMEQNLIGFPNSMLL
jgi:hypothetical protein